jgi:hypothetical protein
MTSGKKESPQKTAGNNVHCGYGSNYSGFPMRVTDTGFFMFFTDWITVFGLLDRLFSIRSGYNFSSWYGLINWTIGLL